MIRATCYYCGGRDAIALCVDDEATGVRKPICGVCSAGSDVEDEETDDDEEDEGPSLADRVRALFEEHRELTVAAVRAMLPDVQRGSLGATIRFLATRGECEALSRGLYRWRVAP